MSALEQAQAHLVAVLADERSAYDLNRDNPLASVASELLRNLESMRDEYERLVIEIKHDLDRSAPYVRGQVASWNSSGILQSSAQRVDQIAVSFAAQSSLAAHALLGYYEQEVASA